MKYSYQIELGKFWQGLPAAEVESETLDPAQLALLRLGVDVGVYVPETGDPDPLLPPAEPTPADPAPVPQATMPADEGRRATRRR